MALELDPQSIKEALQRAWRWTLANPIYAALAGGALLIVLLFAAIVASVTHTSVTPEKVHIAEDDPNLCVRMQKLLAIEPSMEKRGISREYQSALVHVFKELLGDEPTPDDLAVLCEASARCEGLPNDDFAWLVALDARLKRGQWPDKPKLPPTQPALRERLTKAIEKYTALHVVLPAETAEREAWLTFAARADPPQKILLKLFSTGTPDADVQLYQQLVRLAPDSPVVGEIYDRLGFLTQPIYVTDSKGGGPPASAQMPIGVDGTLPFLGVISGEECALAADKRPHPALVVRSCNGLVPRRLPQGEVILLGAETHFEGDTSLRWLPVVVGDDHTVRFGPAGKVSEKLLAAFVQAAPRYTLEGKPFAGDLAPVLADGKPLTFRSPTQKMSTQKVIEMLAFAQKAPVHVEKKDCPKIERSRCESRKDEEGGSDRCDIGPPLCLALADGHTIRVARALMVHSEPCMHEYGEKNVCLHHDTYSLFVDVRAKGEKAFSENAALPIAETAPRAAD